MLPAFVHNGRDTRPRVSADTAGAVSLHFSLANAFNDYTTVGLPCVMGSFFLAVSMHIPTTEIGSEA